MIEIDHSRLHKYKHLYEKNIAILVRFACRFIPKGAAEDMVQDIFLELWNSNKVLEETSSRAYLFTAVRNRCINFLKQEQIKDAYMNHTMIDAKLRGLNYFDSIEKLIIETEQLQQVYDQIEQLPDKCRQIFKLAYFEEKKSNEIADTLQLSIRTIEHQLYLGLKTLRKKLLKIN